MSERVTMPALGESVTEGTVTRWLKAVGDRIEVDEPLLEVSTDKVDTEIPSPIAGTLQEILAEEDETVAVGADLAVIGDGAAPSGGDDAPAEESASADEPAPAATTEDNTGQSGDGDAVHEMPAGLPRQYQLPLPHWLRVASSPALKPPGMATCRSAPHPFDGMAWHSEIRFSSKRTKTGVLRAMAAFWA